MCTHTTILWLQGTELLTINYDILCGKVKILLYSTIILSD